MAKPEWMRNLEIGIDFAQGSTFRGIVRLLGACLAGYFLVEGDHGRAIGTVAGVEAISGMIGAGVKS